MLHFSTCSQSGFLKNRLAERSLCKTQRKCTGFQRRVNHALCRPTGNRGYQLPALPFRNPAGHAIKESLTTLARELLGEMDEKAIVPALDALVRLRAVQDFRPSEALRFIFVLREVVAEVTGEVPQALESRIDELALMAFDQYMACRDQIAGLREKELRFRMQHATG